jgi:hypothetical protein
MVRDTQTDRLEQICLEGYDFDVRDLFSRGSNKLLPRYITDYVDICF